MSPKLIDFTVAAGKGLAVLAVVVGLFATAHLLLEKASAPPIPLLPMAGSAEPLPQGPSVGDPVESSPPQTSVVDQQASLAAVPTTSPSSEPTVVADVAPQVVSIQTVPAVRDLLFELDGRMVATDERGVLDLEPGDFDARIEVIGIDAQPALSEVEFVQWSDGSADTIRSLADVPGPIVQLGLVVRNRVVVRLAESSTRADVVSFRTDRFGSIDVPVGEPTFLVHRFAVPADGALIESTAEYVRVGGPDDVVFRARPESTWTIDLGS